MIFSENRYPLFRIMLLFGHDLFGKPVPNVPDHAMAIDDIAAIRNTGRTSIKGAW
jgi:hypothetical protein